MNSDEEGRWRGGGENVNGESKPQLVGHRAKFISTTRPHVTVFGRLLIPDLRAEQRRLAVANGHSGENKGKEQSSEESHKAQCTCGM